MNNSQTTDDEGRELVVSDPPSHMIEKIRANSSRVTMLPDIAVRALDMVKNVDTTVQAFADLIQQDFKLSTDVLSMANSVMYSPGPTTASLSQAICRLGFNQCKNLIISSSIGSAMQEMDLEEEWTRDVLWKHSLLTGMIAINLNHSLRAGFAGEEFAGGLVHDFGRLLVAATCPESFKEFDPLDFDEPDQLIVRETQILGTNHCVIGAWFAQEQGLPEVLCDVVRFHHQPQYCEENLRLVALTATADHIANHYHRFGETEEYDPTLNKGPQFLEQSGIPNAVEEFQRIAQDVLEAGVQQASEVAST